ncbi:hypothetical protein SteCoe_5180 [Stentor coeruleus]|uniref:Uncharacterized protein n=1 Tax=Stentor coeruleus TaxID=5963 RepID=A0A1R2CSU0_9CILI|nr:hypothetical protein SteCoe_5180 [Stentor coeruleus]
MKSTGENLMIGKYQDSSLFKKHTAYKNIIFRNKVLKAVSPGVPLRTGVFPSMVPPVVTSLKQKPKSFKTKTTTPLPTLSKSPDPRITDNCTTSIKLEHLLYTKYLEPPYQEIEHKKRLSDLHPTSSYFINRKDQNYSQDYSRNINKSCDYSSKQNIVNQNGSAFNKPSVRNSKLKQNIIKNWNSRQFLKTDQGKTSIPKKQCKESDTQTNDCICGFQYDNDSDYS